MRMKSRITAAAFAVGFGVVTLVTMLLCNDGMSITRAFEKLESMDWRDVLMFLTYPIAVLLVGYLVWSLLLCRPVATRRKALVIGTLAGVMTTISTPFMLWISGMFVTLTRRMAFVHCDGDLTWRGSLGDLMLALLVASNLLLPLTIAGLISGWFLPLRRTSGGGDAPASAAPPSPTRDGRVAPRRDGGDDPTRIAMQPAS